MRRTFSDSGNTIVTTGTTSYHMTMINDGYRRPRGGNMASFTHIGGIEVIQRFSSRVGAVVALNTTPRYAGVVEFRTHPRRGGMTSVAFRHRGNMISAFTNGLYSVVTTRTGAHDLSIIHA
jgi:hypothetical protein